MDDHFWQLGLEFLELHQTLQNHPPMRVVLTQSQKDYFLYTFSAIQDRYLDLQTDDYVATVRRMGLNAFRLAMILVALRTLEDGEITEQRECTNLDFENVMIMVKVLIKHSSRVFNCLPEEVKLAARSYD